uniref:Exonuclease domain-containing protein n=1 Tax=Pyramimonas obovata TaxID=1411642 RepID=A0A7S0RKY5_9CHLO|mmetsp:Transcript_36687/g.79927  ORF Transcript_36687/g.79927 Transcript_36687/m.79927 type:complete len:231 (+) Transcript_36687:255-947(+)|eukprot:CAMPEP_0118945500 /NCGR_PEP_ID=MMETSP1169-20130426/42381_1 /TAXON_ID=36882 /ORGANISM="Pyramimonas obovata, Strain CCMP722" /LENGTH=230 /DNA_ID=CAMNT_0006891229 /DNA_START=215 /DNA_END=907 /DNA_ORIENTATION=-
MLHNHFALLEDAEEAPEEPNEMKQTSKRDKNDKKKKKIKSPLVWIDLEMTGLDLEKDVILQIAVLITDGDLESVIEGPELVIHQSEEVLQNMNDWCIEHHGKSGLTEAVRQSKLTMRDAENQVLHFVQQHVKPKEGIVAGNSVHVDVSFLKKDMKELCDYFHYRILDVSTVKELAKRWYPSSFSKAPKKMLAHTAMSDIRESLAELRYWRQAIFREKSGPQAAKHLTVSS